MRGTEALPDPEVQHDNAVGRSVFSREGEQSQSSEVLGLILVILT